MNTLLAILKVIDARRDVILAGGLSHLFAWTHLPSSCTEGLFFFIFRWSGWKVAYGGLLRRSEVENIFENKCVYLT